MKSKNKKIRKLLVCSIMTFATILTVFLVKINAFASDASQEKHPLVLVNNKPTLKVKDVIIKKGDNFDLKSMIERADDKEDGPNLDNNVMINRGEFNSSRVGKYEIIFTLIDSSKASVTKKATVTVIENDENNKNNTENSNTVIENDENNKNNTENSNRNVKLNNTIASPKTGDNKTSLYVFIVLAIISISGFAVMIITKKHR